MNFERYTERARGFLQAAQTIATREGHPQFTPAHILKALLDDPEGMAAGLIGRAGGDAAQARREVDAGSPSKPKVSGAAAQPQATRDLMRLFDTAEKAADKAGDRFVTVERLLLALAIEKDTEAGRVLARAGVAASPQRGDRGPAQGPHRRQRLGRERLRRAEEVRARPDRGRPRGQARPGDRPRRGDPPHHPGAVAAYQEQPGAHRRARRRQDRHRRGARAAHRQRRRAREPEGQEAARPRHGRADRRREVSRRVRGAAQGRAPGGDGGRGRDHPVHRRDAHARRRRQGRRAPWTPRTCSSRRWRAASCTASARPRSTSTASMSRRMRRWPGASSRSSSASRPSRTRSRSCAASRRSTSSTTACASRMRRSSPRRPCRTATSPTASCPTRRSTSWTRPPRACACRSIRSPRSSTTSTARSCG